MNHHTTRDEGTKLHTYGSGKLQICFMVAESHVQDLINNGFDTIVLVDNCTGTRIEIEVTDCHLEELVLLGQAEDHDIKIA